MTNLTKDQLAAMARNERNGKTVERMRPKRRRIEILPRHAHSMGYTVAARLNAGEHVEYPDNPFPLGSENFKAWHEGYGLARA